MMPQEYFLRDIPDTLIEAHGLAAMRGHVVGETPTPEQWAAALAWIRTAGEVARGLQQDDIPFLPIKGWDVSHRLYDIPVLRPMHDVDVWVSLQDYERACAVLRKLGYSPEKQGSYDSFWINPARVMGVELHHALHEPGRAGIAWQACWPHAQDWEFEGLRMKRMSIHDLWLYLAFHYAKHMGLQRRLLWLLDLHLLADQEAIAWEALVVAAEQYRVLHAAHVALWELQRFGLAAPQGAPAADIPLIFQPDPWATHLSGAMRQQLYHLWLVDRWAGRLRYAANRLMAP